MATTWPTFTSENILSGKGAETTGQAIFDIQSCVKGKGSSFWFADVTTTSTTYETKATFEYLVPPYADSGDIIQWTIRGKTSDAAKTLTYQASESAGTNGTEITSTSTTNENMTSEITIPDGTWAGTVKTFYIKAKITSGGTGTLGTDRLACNVRIKG